MLRFQLVGYYRARNARFTEMTHINSEKSEGKT